MALKRYEDASKTALIIARQEQDLGNYPLAHSVIVETIRSLEDAGVKISLQIRQLFILLHSYMLVKIHVRHNEHLAAGRLLLRVAQSISRFPQHIVQILTSTVIECQRGGLKASAYEYAVMLMKPEHRQAIDVNLRRKIEAIVRRKSSVLTDEIPDELTSCPVTNDGTTIPAYQLESTVTRDAIPMCVITGKHMVLTDWCFCPNSKFPALYSEYLGYIQKERQLAQSAASEGVQANDDEKASLGPSSPTSRSPTAKPNANVVLDPVLGKPISEKEITLCSIEEAMKYIQKYNNVIDEKKDADSLNLDSQGGESSLTGGEQDDDNDMMGGDNEDDGLAYPSRGKTLSSDRSDRAFNKAGGSNDMGVVSFAMRDYENEGTAMMPSPTKGMMPPETGATRAPGGRRKKVSYNVTDE
jgi:WD repeat-containing protein 19